MHDQRCGEGNSFRPAFALVDVPQDDSHASKGDEFVTCTPQQVAYTTPARLTSMRTAEASARLLADTLGKDRTLEGASRPARNSSTKWRWPWKRRNVTGKTQGRLKRMTRPGESLKREFARLQGFDPNLKQEWITAHPERENLKLAGYLLFFRSVCGPPLTDEPGSETHERVPSLPVSHAPPRPARDLAPAESCAHCDARVGPAFPRTLWHNRAEAPQGRADEHAGHPTAGASCLKPVASGVQ